ncbi:MAG: HAD family hydrolase [Anaerolineales bacterium]
MEQVNTVLFDLDDTLRYNDPHAHTFFCDYVQSLGIRLTAGQRRVSQRWEHTYWASSNQLTSDIEDFVEGSEGFWLNYSSRHLQALGVPKDQADHLAADVHRHMRDNYEPRSYIPNENIEALSGLRRAGFKLGVITNRPKPIHSEMNTLNLDTYLDFFLTAAQLGAYKPDPTIFNNLLAFIGRPASDVVYVGDNYYADIVGARNAGIRPILLNWNALYDKTDCEEITSLRQLPEILQPAPIRN